METILLSCILAVLVLQLLLLTVYVANSDEICKRYARRRRKGKYHNIIDWMHWLLR